MGDKSKPEVLMQNEKGKALSFDAGSVPFMESKGWKRVGTATVNKPSGQTESK